MRHVIRHIGRHKTDVDSQQVTDTLKVVSLYRPDTGYKRQAMKELRIQLLVKSAVCYFKLDKVTGHAVADKTWDRETLYETGNKV